MLDKQCLICYPHEIKIYYYYYYYYYYYHTYLTGALSSVAWSTGAQLMVFFCFRFPVLFGRPSRNTCIMYSVSVAGVRFNNVDSSAQYLLCKEAGETVEHFILTCKVLEPIRQSVILVDTLNETYNCAHLDGLISQ